MFYRFRKKDFLILFQEQNKGTLITISRDN